MACNKATLAGYLKDFSGQRPLDAIICPFAGPNGAGAGEPVFALVVVGLLGLGLALRTRHPGPILVAGMLSAGLFATALPAGAVTIFALVLFFGIVAGGFFVYQRFKTSL